MNIIERVGRGNIPGPVFRGHGLGSADGDESMPDETQSVRGELATRSTFRLIEEFHRGCRQAASPMRQAATLNAVVELARVDFALMAWLPWSSRQLSSDCARCLVDLQGLVGELARGASPPANTLLHALDTLIVLLIQNDRPTGRWPAKRCTEGRRAVPSQGYFTNQGSKLK